MRLAERGDTVGCQARMPRSTTTTYVSIRQHTSAYVSKRQHTSAYVTRQHTSYVSIHVPLRLGWQTRMPVYAALSY
jgi:hypothetical protein